MTVLESIILGVIQGITEFIPISSSAHLVISTRLFGLTDPASNLAFIVFLHLASTLTIIIVFLPELLEALTKPRLIGLVIIGTIPAAMVGLLLEDTLTAVFSGLWLVGLALMVNAFILTLADLTNSRQARRLNLREAILIGLAQAVAIIPGISRSGITISTGLMSGLPRKEAINFSFFLAIPVILGAALWKLKDFGKFTTSFEPISILAGSITCFIVSFIALKLLIRVVLKGKLYYFGIYCLLLGLTAIVLAIIIN